MDPITIAIAAAAAFFLLSSRDKPAPAPAPSPAPSGGGSSGGSRAPRGIRNNNPGNIRISADAWQGKVPREKNTDGVFEQFVSPEYGIRAMLKLLQNYIKAGYNTPAKIITKWAPPSENNTAAYISTVEGTSSLPRSKTIAATDKVSIIRLAAAMIRVENTVQPYSGEQLGKAWSLI